MNMRLLLNIVHGWLIQAHGEDEAWEMLNPPTPEELRAAHYEQLRALGIPIEAA